MGFFLGGGRNTGDRTQCQTNKQAAVSIDAVTMVGELAELNFTERASSESKAFPIF